MAVLGGLLDGSLLDSSGLLVESIGSSWIHVYLSGSMCILGGSMCILVDLSWVQLDPCVSSWI